MARPIGPRKLYRYSPEFRATAVRLSELSDVAVQDVAQSLDVHPFLLSRWRRDAREGRLVTKQTKLDETTKAELKELRQVKRAYARAQGGARAFKKSHPVRFRTRSEIFEFIHARKETNRIALMCRLYGVTRGGYYAWCDRRPSARAQYDVRLLDQIRQVHAAHDGNYGSPRVHGALRPAGVRVGAKRVARLMRVHRLRGKIADLYRSRAGTKAFFTSIPNRQLGVLANAPNRVWVGDVTYLKVAGVWRYLAVILDKHSRRVLAWTLRRRRDVDLTLRTLRLAVRARRPQAGLIFHSDRGIEYAAEPYREGLRVHGFIQSMNRPKRMNDNAHMESFFHTMKSELHKKLCATSDTQLRAVIATYMDYYNERRGHTSLDHRTPAHFEA